MEDVRPAKPAISFDDFSRLDLRIARVTACRVHPNADKLLVITVDIGGHFIQICAGLQHHYEPRQLIGRQVVVLTNLEPRTMRGERSEGLLLAAHEGAFKSRVAVLTTVEEISPGAAVS